MRWINKKSIISGKYLEVSCCCDWIRSGVSVVRSRDVCIMQAHGLQDTNAHHKYLAHARAHTEVEIRAVHSQIKRLLFHKLSSSRHNYPNHSILTKNADSRAGEIQAKRSLVTHKHTYAGRDTQSHVPASRPLSNFGEFKSPRWQTNSLGPVEKPLFGQMACVTSSALQQMAISTLTLNLLQVIWKVAAHPYWADARANSTQSWPNSLSEESMEATVKGLLRAASLIILLSSERLHSTALTWDSLNTSQLPTGCWWS